MSSRFRGITTESQEPLGGKSVSNTRSKQVAAGLLVLWLTLVGVVVLWPTPVDSAARGLIKASLNWLHAAGVPSFVDYNLVETGANVLMFAPIGGLTAVLLPPAYRWLAVAGAFLLSLAIELVQDMLLPERFASLQDVLANTLGAALGTIAVWSWLERRAQRSPESDKTIGNP